MTKDDLKNFTPKEAFSHGKKMHQEGKSIDYNPYRNLDSNYADLFNAWVLGWNS